VTESWVDTLIVDRWTQAILPPGSDENPNVPGI
jgi:hypothetical protein